MKRPTQCVLLVVIMIVAGLGAFVYSGLYNIGADAPHTKPVLAVLQTLRERSIHIRSKDIAPPNLDDPQLILKGAGQYAAMCVDCHLRPGMKDSEIRSGLYPQPPNLSHVRVDPKAAFWVIKHGIKMSAMPAWGTTHEDPALWSLVAFLQQLPDLTPAQYKDMVAKAPPDEEMGEGGHSHGGDDAGENYGAAGMPGMMPMAADAHGEGHSHSQGEEATGRAEHEHTEAVSVPEAGLSVGESKPKIDVSRPPTE